MNKSKRPPIVAKRVYLTLMIAFVATLTMVTGQLLPNTSHVSAFQGSGSCAPATCKAIQDSNPGATDGDYTISPNGMTFTVYCKNMNTTSPKEYLTLVVTSSSPQIPPGTLANFSEDAVDNCNGGNCSSLTLWQKVRIIPSTLQVDITDTTFTSATKVGEPNSPSFPTFYATARGCGPVGYANINLTGTPFKVNDTFTNVNGFGTATFSSNDQIVDITGNGGCGTNAPTGAFHAGIDGCPSSVCDGFTPIGFLKLAFTGSIAPPNSPPVVTNITAPLSPVQVGTEISASADFTDTGDTNPHEAVFAWGDGSTSTAITSSNSVSSNHSYSTPGVYTVTLTVTDSCGLSGSSTFQYYIVVYDPDGGFVTGGGWINSPTGAYTADPGLAGKANFGFVSKYQPGATDPTGNTEFQFKAGNLNFKSTSYEWLVVAGAKAQFKGTGTINGTGSYSFILTAIDGQINGDVDKFRIKITGAGGGLVYDNQMGASDTADQATALGGGSIVIHK
jgi:PKD repeat protein